MALHRGDSLEGFALASTPKNEAWQAAEADRYRGMVVSALEEFVSDPLHEPIHWALARAPAGADRRAAALNQLDAWRLHLTEE